MTVEEITNALGERADEWTSLDGVIAVNYHTVADGSAGFISIKVADEDQKIVRSFDVMVREIKL